MMIKGMMNPQPIKPNLIKKDIRYDVAGVCFHCQRADCAYCINDDECTCNHWWNWDWNKIAEIQKIIREEAITGRNKSTGVRENGRWSA